MAAIDPEFGKAIEARNQRRHAAAARVVEKLGSRMRVARGDGIASLVAMTSFEFFDVLAESLGSVEEAENCLPILIRNALVNG
jgi:hypothetical protein